MLKFSGYSYLISGHSLENLEKFALLLELREANTNAARSRLAFFLRPRFSSSFRFLSFAEAGRTWNPEEAQVLKIFISNVRLFCLV